MPFKNILLSAVFHSPCWLPTDKFEPKEIILGKKLKTEWNWGDDFSHIYEKQQTSESLMRNLANFWSSYEILPTSLEGGVFWGQSQTVCLLMKLIGSRVNHLMNWEKRDYDDLL